MRTLVTLACTECKRRNYISSKNKKRKKQALSLPRRTKMFKNKNVFKIGIIAYTYETERKEGIEAGVSVLVGADYDKIVKLSSDILSKPKEETVKDEI